MKKLLLPLIMLFNVIYSNEIKEIKESIIIIKNQIVSMNDIVASIISQIESLSIGQKEELSKVLVIKEWYKYSEKKTNSGANPILRLESILKFQCRKLSTYPNDLNTLLIFCTKGHENLSILKQKIGKTLQEIINLMVFIKNSGISQEILDRSGFEY